MKRFNGRVSSLITSSFLAVGGDIVVLDLRSAVWKQVCRIVACIDSCRHVTCRRVTPRIVDIILLPQGLD